MRRCAAIEPVIGHVRAEHRIDFNYLKGRSCDRKTTFVRQLPRRVATRYETLARKFLAPVCIAAAVIW